MIPDSVTAVEKETFTATSLEAARSYTRAQVLMETGKWQEAIDQFNRGAELAPKRAFRFRPGLAEAHWRRGQANQEAGRTTEAEADFRRAKELGWQTL